MGYVGQKILHFSWIHKILVSGWVALAHINDYYNQLRFILDQIDLSDPTWACSKDAQQYATVWDEFHLYEFLMSLNIDYEPIWVQLLNRSPPPSLDTIVNELVREEVRLANLQAQNKLNILATAPLTKQPSQLGL